MNKLVALALLAGLAASSSAQEAALAAFARSNAGKFTSEIAGLPKVFTVRVRPFDGWWLDARFDQSQGTVNATTAVHVRDEWVYQRCTRVRTFEGQNSYGAKARVAESRCERLEIQDQSSSEPSGMHLAGLSFPATPAQFRSVKALGVLYEVEFEVGPEFANEVVADGRVATTPTVAEPELKRIRVLTVRGKVRSVRVLSHDGSLQFARFDR